MQIFQVPQCLHTEIDYTLLKLSECSFSETYLVHASLYGTSVPELIRTSIYILLMEMWFIDCSCIRGGERGTAEFLRHLPVQQLQDPEAVFAVQ